MLHVALYHPAIPQNTGNIARTTVAFGAHLHLIHPMSFEITEHAVKRAGLDYWPSVRLTQHDNDDAFLAWLQVHLTSPRKFHPSKPTAEPSETPARSPTIHLITKFGDTRFDHAAYGPDDVLLFGNENSGLPLEFHDATSGPLAGATRITIPMPGPADGSPNVRSLNVANTVAIVLALAAVRISDSPSGF